MTARYFRRKEYVRGPTFDPDQTPSILDIFRSARPRLIEQIEVSMFKLDRSGAVPTLVTILLLALIAPSGPANAYIGPGLDLGTLGAGIGVLMTSASAVFYLVTLTVRRTFKRLLRVFTRRDARALEVREPAE
jgi:hypothetical protein